MCCLLISHCKKVKQKVHVARQGGKWRERRSVPKLQGKTGRVPGPVATGPHLSAHVDCLQVTETMVKTSEKTEAHVAVGLVGWDPVCE